MSIDFKSFYSKIEAFRSPSVILFRSIELSLVKKYILDKLKAKRVLDLGCGDGVTVGIVFDKKVEYGLDNSEIFLKEAKTKRVYKKLILADAENMLLKNGACDLVFSNCVIEHIKDLDSVLRETSRVLSKNGNFVFTSLTENFVKYSIFSKPELKLLSFVGKWYMLMRDRKLQHYHGYSLEDWSKKLNKHGFKVVDWFYYLDKKTIEYWDFLMLLSYCLRKVSIKLDDWVYRKFFKESIYQKFLKAKATGKEGAAIGVLAQKI